MIKVSIKHLDRACLATVIVVSLASGYLSFTHVSKKRQQFGVEKETLSRRVQEVNLAEANLEELKAALADTKEELNYLNERIPEPGKIGVLLKKIDSLMKRRKMTLVNLQPLPVREEKLYYRNPIQLTFKGNFINIFDVIHDLERINRVVLMDKMNISKKQDSDQCQVELMASVFERKKPSDLGIL
jgi:Tfp pilus assembly protein PilO